MRKFIIYIFVVLLLFQFGCGSTQKRLIVSFDFDPPITENLIVGIPVTFRIPENKYYSNAGPPKNYFWQVTKGDTGMNPTTSIASEFTTTFIAEGDVIIKLTIDFGTEETKRSTPDDKVYKVVLDKLILDIKTPSVIDIFPLYMDSQDNPSMPSNIKCKGSVRAEYGRVNPATLNIDYKWSINTYTVFTTGPGGIHYDENMASITLDYDGFQDKEWNPNFAKIGGLLQLWLKAEIKDLKIPIKPPEAVQRIIKIDGKNPSKGFIASYMGDTPAEIASSQDPSYPDKFKKLYKSICFVATSWSAKQFDYSDVYKVNVPYVDAEAEGIGLMGLRNTKIITGWETKNGEIVPKVDIITITNEEMWNWKKNIDRGKEIYNRKLGQAKITHGQYPDPDGSGPKIAAPEITETFPEQYALTKEALSLYRSDYSYWKWDGTSWKKDASNIKGTKFADNVLYWIDDWTTHLPPFSGW